MYILFVFDLYKIIIIWHIVTKFNEKVHKNILCYLKSVSNYRYKKNSQILLLLEFY